MLSNLKKNHRYVFYKKLPNSDYIKEFRAILISVNSNTLLVHSYESEDQVYYTYSKHCVWSMPSQWIVKVEVSDEDEVVDHDDIFVSSTEEMIVLE
jgi:hypothetical protein